jgi:hypothetical protein
MMVSSFQSWMISDVNVFNLISAERREENGDWDQALVRLFKVENESSTATLGIKDELGLCYQRLKIEVKHIAISLFFN